MKPDPDADAAPPPESGGTVQGSPSPAQASPGPAQAAKAGRLRPTGRLVPYSLLAVLALLLGVGLLPVPYIKLSPGQMYNVIGDIDGIELIKISDTRTYPTSGQLDMVTVTERGGPAGPMTIPEAYLGWLDPDQRVVPERLLYPPGQSLDESRRINAAQFSQAESNAVAAALKYLKRPVQNTVMVLSVVVDGPSYGKLEPNDVILRIGGVKVSNAVEVAEQVRAQAPGNTLTFDVIRADKEQAVAVVLGATPENPDQGMAGIVAAVRYSADFPIEFGIKDIGGPSAGLMLSLGIIDKLSPESINGGRLVAGTGTIDPEGKVGKIGGIAQKMASARKGGAQLFLAPADNCADVGAAGPQGLNVAKVETLTEAVDVLRSWLKGRTDLPRCG